MFTGIVKAILPIHSIENLPGIMKLHIQFDETFIKDLEIGASIAINGTCLTVVSINRCLVSFDIIQETLNKTNLGFLFPGQLVNIERSAKFGDEIGGHILSGHILGMAEINSIHHSENNQAITFKTPASSIKYIFQKGYIAIDGISLTVVNVNPDECTFSVHLIPETLAKTTLAKKLVGEKVNIEIDSSTQTIVDTIERTLLSS